jgi:hypothetical protein
MLGKGIRKIIMKTQLLFNGWGAHYHPDCWFDSSKDDLSVNDKGVIVGFQPEEYGLTMKKAYERSKKG